MAPMDQSQKSEHMPQGGGVYILDGTVNFQECNIYGNTADYVSAHAPHWSMAPMELTVPRCVRRE